MGVSASRRNEEHRIASSSAGARLSWTGSAPRPVRVANHDQCELIARETGPSRSFPPTRLAASPRSSPDDIPASTAPSRRTLLRLFRHAIRRLARHPLPRSSRGPRDRRERHAPRRHRRDRRERRRDPRSRGRLPSAHRSHIASSPAHRRWYRRSRDRRRRRVADRPPNRSWHRRHRGGASAGHRRRHLRGPAVRRLPSGLLRRRRAQGDAGPNPAHRGHQGRRQCGQVHRSARDLLLLARTHLQRHQCQAHRRTPLRLPEARRQQRFAHHSAGRPQGQEDRRALPVQLGLRLFRQRRHRLGDH